MAIGPWNPKAAGAMGHGLLRASDADRERVIDALKDAFVQGLLTKDELGMRTGQALAARTNGELTAITADISAATQTRPRAQPSEAAPPRTPRRVNKKAVAWGTCAIVLPPALSAAFLTYYGGFLVVFLFAFIGTVVSARS